MLIAVWQYIAAFIALIGIAAIAVFAIPAATGDFYGCGGMMDNYYYNDMGRTGAIVGLSIGIFFVACYLAVTILGGIGLLMGKEWGRILSIKLQYVSA